MKALEKYYQPGCNLAEKIQSLGSVTDCPSVQCETTHNIVMDLALSYALWVQNFLPSPETSASKLANNCALDVYSTAALLREIAFGVPFEASENGSFLGLDLGTGTGVLAIGMVAAALRKGVALQNIRVIGVEKDPDLLVCAERIFDDINKTVGATVLTIQKDDITNPKILASAGVPSANMIVSETISPSTIPFYWHPKQTKRLSHPKDHLWSSLLRRPIKGDWELDPYVQVILACRHVRESFSQDIWAGSLGMFPLMTFPFGRTYTQFQNKLLLLEGNDGQRTAYALSEVGMYYSCNYDCGVLLEVSRRWA